MVEVNYSDCKLVLINKFFLGGVICSVFILFEISKAFVKDKSVSTTLSLEFFSPILPLSYIQIIFSITLLSNTIHLSLLRCLFLAL